MLRLMKSISVNFAALILLSMSLIASDNAHAVGFNSISANDPRIQGVLDVVMRDSGAVRDMMTENMGKMMGRDTMMAPRNTVSENALSGSVVVAANTMTPAAMMMNRNTMAPSASMMMNTNTGAGRAMSANTGIGIFGSSLDVPVASVDDPRIKSIMDSALQDQAVLKSVMMDTRNEIMVRQAKATPFIRDVGDAISRVVSDRVRKEVREATRARQMGAMQDASNPDGIPILIAPNFQ
jgi:hypothetical protein